MKKTILVAAALVAIPAVASAQSFNFPSGGKKTGFTEDTSTVTTVSTTDTQGRSGKPAQDNGNQGTSETTTTTTVVTEETGPKGVLKNNNTDNPNFESTIIAIETSTAETDAPGKSSPK
jgi:hypothetical protein